MGKKEQLIERLLRMPKDFEQREMDTLLKQCGCVLDNRGKTSGSAIRYTHKATGKVFTYHHPHPGNIIMPYVLKGAKEFLQIIGEIR